MPISQLLTPYRVSKGLELRPSDTRLPPLDEDGYEISWPTRAGEDEPLTLDMSKVQDGWNEVAFTIDATITQDELDDVLPSGASIEADTRLLISIHCTATKLHRVIEAQWVGGRWTTDAHIARAEVRGTVKIEGQLVRATALLQDELSEPGFATEAGQVIAEGTPLAIAVDSTPRLLRGVIETRWRHFKDEGDDWQRAHPNDPFHLDLERDEPVLYLNSRYAKFRAAMHETRETGRDAVIRHLGNTGIAQAVWLQLFVAAVVSLELDEQGIVRQPTQPWKKEALSMLTTQLFVGIDAEEQLRRLNEMKGAEQIESLLPWLSTIAQTTAKTGSLINRAIAAAEELSDDNGGAP